MERTGYIVYTIGHSTWAINEFIESLKVYQIEQVVDIRTIPRSGHNPQFNKDAIAKSLRNRHINYRHMKYLGGLRHAAKDSINKGWINSSFRGFADYMQTDEFDKALEKLIDLSTKKTIAIMCAEAVPWRCHRSLIADALTVRNIPVENIFSKTNVKEHTMTSFARIKDGKITYPEEDSR